MRGTKARLLLGGAAAVAACLLPTQAASGSPSANGRIYYGNYNAEDISIGYIDGVSGGSIGAGGNVSGTAIDAANGNIYWSDDATHHIMVAPLNNIGASSVLNTTGATQNGVRGLALDLANGKIYWANEAVNTISWAALDGSGGGDFAAPGSATVNGPSGVTVDTTTNRLYWANDGDNTHPIAWASLGGSGKGDGTGNNLATTGATASGARGPSIDQANGKIYWANFSNNTISYANLDDSGGGGQLNISGSTPNEPHGTALDANDGYIYWTNYNATTGQALSWAALDGSGGGDVASGAHSGTALFPTLLEVPAGSVSLLGSPEVGATLTCSAGWLPDDTGAHLARAPSSATTYTWTSDGTPIDGQTDATYDVQTTDVGHQIGCTATASNDAGPTTLTSDVLTVGPSEIFWANALGNAIDWSTVDGSSQGTLDTTGATVDIPSQVVVDAADDKVWWANFNNTISYANTDGGGGGELNLGGADATSVWALAVDSVNQKVYWTNRNDNTIWWASMDGSGTHGQLDTTGATVSTPSGLAIDYTDNRIYWTNSGDDGAQVSYASLSGGSGHDFDTTQVPQASATGVAVDPATGEVYWADADAIVSAGVDGQNASVLYHLTPAEFGPFGVAIDPADGTIYWANTSSSTISYASLDGSTVTPSTISTGNGSFPVFPTLLAAPEPLGVPTITGAARPGQTLTCSQALDESTGTQTSRDPLSTSYAWLLDGIPIDGQAASTYEVATSDVGHSLACQVTESNDAGDTTVQSAGVEATSPGVIYWANYNAGTVSYANLDGSGGADFVTGLINPESVAINAADGLLYFAEGSSSYLLYDNLNGSGGVQGIDGGDANVVRGMVYVGSFEVPSVIWSSQTLGLVVNYPSEGASSFQTIIPPSLESTPAGVAYDSADGWLYFTNGGNDSAPIGQTYLAGVGVPDADLDTTGATASSARGLAVDVADNRVYWANYSNNTISYASLAGGGGGQLNLNGAPINEPYGMAFDPETRTLYWANFNDNSHPIVAFDIDTSTWTSLPVGSATVNGALYPSLLEPPLGTGAPNVSGTAVPGASLSCSPGSWAGDYTAGLLYRTPAGYAYQWLRDGTPIDGATSSTYQLAAVDARHSISCEVTAVNYAGSTTQVSSASTPTAYGAPAKLVITSSTSNLAAGTPRILTAKVEDALGNTVTNATNAITFSKLSGTGTVSGLAAAHASNGVATLQISGGAAGSITIRATASGLTAGTTTFDVVPGAATKLVFTSSTANLTSGGTPRALSVKVEDAGGNQIASPAKTVTFAKTSGAGTVTGLGSANSSGGVASKPVTGVKAGAVTIRATAAGLTAANTTFTVVPGAPHELVFLGSHANLASGATRQLQVEVEDAAGNKVTSPTKTVGFSKIDGTGTVTGLGNAVSSGGIASKTVTGVKAGSITILAGAAGITPAATTFTVVPGAAHKLVFTSATTGLGLGKSRTLTVEVEDAAGNKVATPAKTVAFAKLSGAGAVSGLGSVLSAGGIASKSVKATGKGSITIKATVSGLTAGTTTFTITS